MKIWYGFGSEHSMNLVMIGRFKSVRDAAEAKRVIDGIAKQVASDVDAGRMEAGEQTVRFNDGMLALLRTVNVFTIAPGELDQFAYDFTVEATGDRVVIRTDEYEWSAFLKVLVDKGARVEVYSAHHYPETEDGDDG